MIREQARKSDVVAKTGASQIAILAPDTDAAGARLLALDEAGPQTALLGSLIGLPRLMLFLEISLDRLVIDRQPDRIDDRVFRQ